MRRRIYVILFGLVLLASVLGAVWIGPLLFGDLRQQFGLGPSWSPPEQAASPGPGTVGPTPPAAGVGARVTPSRSPTALTPAPTGALPAGSLPASATPLGAVTATPAEAPTPTQSPTSVLGAFDFVLAHPLRHSVGDCPGSYVLGQIVDGGGNPLPGVKLVLVDEWGNAATAFTKSDAGEQGRYDFPLFGPRRYYLTVSDAGGRVLSAQVEIPHGVGPDAQATCHWADWQRR